MLEEQRLGLVGRKPGAKAEQGAREGAKFIQDHIIEATTKTFDDFAGADIDEQKLKNILGL